MIVNKLNWTSSPAASPELLRQLDRRLAEFYATLSQRREYQQINDDLHDTAEHPNNLLADQLAEYILANGFKDVLEVGCGSGKIFGRLKSAGFSGRYTGIEMADYVIQSNRTTYPDATWNVGSVYDLEGRPASVDCCFAFFVLEHLIYPHKGLAAMLSVVKPGGTLILVFPDMRASGIVASQKVGLQYGMGARYKLKKGKIVDALISLLEGITVRKKLKRLNEIYGDFVINFTPYCLDKECETILPDFDAVYLGSKGEVERWAKARGCSVSYPGGTRDYLYRNAYMSIVKQ